METVIVSPKFQVSIPKEICRELKLRAGQKLFAYVYKRGLHFEISNPVTSIRGIAKGMKWKEEYRDETDRF